MVVDRRLLLVAICLASSGCITGFKHPLGPMGQARIDERLLGVWTCVSKDDQTPGELSFLKFDDRQYFVRMVDARSEAQDLRALVTPLEESLFLSMRVIGPKADDEWTVLQYSMSDVDQLRLKDVDPQEFEDILDEPQAIRDRLVSRLSDPEALADLLQCTRRDPTPAKAGS